MSKLPTTPDEPTLTPKEEARIDEVLTSDAPAPLKALEIVTTALAPMVRHYAALEAAKTPEQRAREALQRQVDAERYAKEKRDKQTAKLRKLYEKWCLRDTWLLDVEAIPLALEEEPTWVSYVIEGADTLLKLAISCAGHSLPIENVSEAQSKWRVKPVNWVHWLKEKGYPVNAQLEARTQPKAREIKAEPQTARATASRERNKALRIADLKRFVADVEQRARADKLPWDRTGIPVTKADFLAEFFKQYPQYSDFSLASFDNDFAEIGVKFRPGVKRKKNNVLKGLFSNG
jgi:hypothetical protein